MTVGQENAAHGQFINPFPLAHLSAPSSLRQHFASTLSSSLSVSRWIHVGLAMCVVSWRRSSLGMLSRQPHLALTVKSTHPPPPRARWAPAPSWRTADLHTHLAQRARHMAPLRERRRLTQVEVSKVIVLYGDSSPHREGLPRGHSEWGTSGRPRAQVSPAARKAAPQCFAPIIRGRRAGVQTLVQQVEAGARPSAFLTSSRALPLALGPHFEKRGTCRRLFLRISRLPAHLNHPGHCLKMSMPRQLNWISGEERWPRGLAGAQPGQPHHQAT